MNTVISASSDRLDAIETDSDDMQSDGEVQAVNEFFF